MFRGLHVSRVPRHRHSSYFDSRTSSVCRRRAKKREGWLTKAAFTREGRTSSPRLSTCRWFDFIIESASFNYNGISRGICRKQYAIQCGLIVHYGKYSPGRRRMHKPCATNDFPSSWLIHGRKVLLVPRKRKCYLDVVGTERMKNVCCIFK